MAAICHFCRANRSWALGQHRALLRGVSDKVLPLFDNAKIELEADAFADESFEHLMSQPVDEDSFIDPGDLAVSAMDEGVGRYQDLMFVKGQLQALSVTALYHLWERTLKEFLIRELRFHGFSDRESCIQRAGFSGLINDLSALGFDATNQSFFETLETVSLVASVCKHGDGRSFKSLVHKAPDLFLGQNEWRRQVAIGEPRAEDLWITSSKFHELGSAIEQFWRSMPERLSVPRNWLEGN